MMAESHPFNPSGQPQPAVQYTTEENRFMLYLAFHEIPNEQIAEAFMRFRAQKPNADPQLTHYVEYLVGWFIDRPQSEQNGKKIISHFVRESKEGGWHGYIRVARITLAKLADPEGADGGKEERKQIGREKLALTKYRQLHDGRDPPPLTEKYDGFDTARRALQREKEDAENGGQDGDNAVEEEKLWNFLKVKWNLAPATNEGSA